LPTGWKNSVCETPACWKSKQRGGVACKRHIPFDIVM
jgi:hypothetical protein